MMTEKVKSVMMKYLIFISIDAQKYTPESIDLKEMGLWQKRLLFITNSKNIS